MNICKYNKVIPEKDKFVGIQGKTDYNSIIVQCHPSSSSGAHHELSETFQRARAHPECIPVY